jgi:hypothetical protein
MPCSLVLNRLCLLFIIIRDEYFLYQQIDIPARWAGIKMHEKAALRRLIVNLS